MEEHLLGFAFIEQQLRARGWLRTSAYNLDVLDPRDRLGLARRELEKAQIAAIDPVDWLDLALYSFFALENVVVAAGELEGIP